MTTSDEAWDRLFDELYLPTYAGLEERDSEAEALGAVGLGGLEPPAEILDAPTGFGRHAIPLAKRGYRVTGIDRSEVQLAEGRRLAGDVEWPRLLQADFRSLPFDGEAFDGVLCLFTSIGYRGEEGDRQAFAEYLRVLRPGGALVIETLHRDRLATIFQERGWDHLPDGAVRLEERRFDLIAGETETELIYLAAGERKSANFRVRVYTATELVGLLADVGFEGIDCFGDLEGAPLSRETRLVVRARKP